MSAPERRIGDVLLAKGLVDEEQLARALEHQRRTGRRVGEILVEDGAITWFDLSMALAEQWEPDDEMPPVTSACAEPREASTECAIEPTIEELQAMLRDRQRRIIELSGTITKLERTVERLQEELRERDQRLVRQATAQEPAA
jgi:chromosome segregation ATPase